MGKAGRIACIFVPMAMSIASLICLLLVWMGGQNRGSELLRDLYFVKFDASNFTSNPDVSLVQGTDFDDQLFDTLAGDAHAGNLKDFYNVHIWNYCEGTINKADGVEEAEITYCSPRKSGFHFNPIEVWGLNGTNVQKKFDDEVGSAMKAYEKVAGWMFAAYAIAFFVTAAEIVVGIFAIFSRWGSLVTTIVSTASTLFTVASAITSTALFGALTGAVNGFLGVYHIKATMSTQMLSVVWIAAAFSTGASFFWLISTCCCSGHSDKKRKTFVEKTPYTYERVHEPEHGYKGQGHSGMPLQTMPQKGNNAYEPFRHG